MTTTTSPWSLSVKRVGVAEGNNYTVLVDPDSNLASLYTEIEGVTGVKANQQRLIYRGRILASTDERDDQTLELGVTKKDPKIKDVIGLCDGQTIHLVPKPVCAVQEVEGHEPPLTTTTAEEGTTGPTDDAPATITPSSRSPDNSTSPTASFLAAILGWNDESDESLPPSMGEQGSRLRSARLRGRRRDHYRLTEEDLVMNDPGSMEPVRQALLTLHSMIHSQTHPELEGHRHWYRGQWLDVRDTVNQWLEATIVEVVLAQDILPYPLRDAPRNRQSRTVEPTTDAVVSANDFEGRMQLFLEPCTGDCDGHWNGFRQRDYNEGVQLLLIHYNGWPHRWDEWIRSDSERIRPFRSRTRHETASLTASPSPLTIFNAAPSTHIKDENDAVERSALLPELQKVIGVVNTLLQTAMVDESGTEPSVRDDSLPWSAEINDEANSIVLDDEIERVTTNAGQQLYCNRRQLEQLAPLLDRLGRALTDAAPHIASFAATLPQDYTQEPPRCIPGECNVVIAGDAEVESLADHDDDVASTLEPARASSLGTGMFSMSDGNTTNVVIPDSNTLLLNSMLDNPDDLSDDAVAPNDVDHADFVASMVNTVRPVNQSRIARRTSPNTSNASDDGSNLLAAYLAAASLSSLASDDGGNSNENASGLHGLGRLLRQRENGSGNGGIDIHIHAFVTGPGVGGGAGFAMLGDPRIGGHGGQTTTRGTGFSGLSSLNQRHQSPFLDFRPTPIAPVNEEELDIFDDLYSDNPSPVDLHSGLLPTERRSRESRLFEHDSDSEFLSQPPNSRSRSGRAPAIRSRSPNQNNSLPNLSESTSPRRGSTLSRIFRRALGRRSNSNFDRLNPSMHDPE